MKKYVKGIVFISMLAIANVAQAQAIYQVQSVNMKLEGTSTMHDWEMKANNAVGEAQFILNSENELTSIKSLTFSIEVKDLRSDSKGLNNNAYKALKTTQYKHISYTLTSAKQSSVNGGYLLKTKGKLTVAGTTKDVAMDIHLVVNKNNTISCEGSHKLKMTDYNVEPPSFMLGAMTTGDETMLHFEVIYTK